MYAPPWERPPLDLACSVAFAGHLRVAFAGHLRVRDLVHTLATANADAATLHNFTRRGWPTAVNISAAEISETNCAYCTAALHVHNMAA